jgi:hypothetical protein
MSNRLPETELANWSFLSPDEKRFELEKFERPKKIIGSYEPFRRVFPDAVNQQFPLFGETLSAVGWQTIEARLVQECRGDADKIRMNKRILGATHEYALANGITATALDVVPLRFVGGVPYDFGLNLLIRYRDRAVVAFLDMRRSNRLRQNGLSFVFSALHHRFREAYPDYAEVGTEIWRYGTTTNRKLTPLSYSGALLDWDEMVSDVRETYLIWDEVRRGGEERRRAGGGSAGPLFD